MNRAKFANDLSLQTGDLIGYSGRGALSDFINIVTFGIPRWHLSHLAMVVVEGGVPHVVEALNSEKRVVKRPLAESLNCPAWVYPLSRSLYQHESDRIEHVLNNAVGTTYDVAGAFWSGGLLTRMVGSFLYKECKAQFFCSELVAYAWSEAGLFDTANFSYWSPNSLARRARWRGTVEKPLRLPECAI